MYFFKYLRYPDWPVPAHCNVIMPLTIAVLYCIKVCILTTCECVYPSFSRQSWIFARVWTLQSFHAICLEHNNFSTVITSSYLSCSKVAPGRCQLFLVYYAKNRWLCKATDPNFFDEILTLLLCCTLWQNTTKKSH